MGLLRPTRGPGGDPRARLPHGRGRAQARRRLSPRRAVPLPVPVAASRRWSWSPGCTVSRPPRRAAGPPRWPSDRARRGRARLHGHLLTGHEEAPGAGPGADPRAARSHHGRADQRARSGGRRADARDHRGSGRGRPDHLPLDPPARRRGAALPPRGHHPRGKLEAVGTLDELRARYEAPGTTLEDLFLRVTTTNEPSRKSGM